MRAQSANIGSIAYDTSWYQPRSGSSYLIIHTTRQPSLLATEPARTYAQIKLTSRLRAGCTYRATFHARLAWGREFTGYNLPPIATDNLGAYFSAQPLLQTLTQPLLLAQPQVNSPRGVLIRDTVTYTPVTGTFVARGDEEYLTIGNFFSDAATTQQQLWSSPRWGGTSRYAIDDVSVEAVPPNGLTLELGPDQWLGACPGAGSVTLTAPAGFGSYRWNTGQTSASI